MAKKILQAGSDKLIGLRLEARSVRIMNLNLSAELTIFPTSHTVCHMTWQDIFNPNYKTPMAKHDTVHT